MFMDHQMFFQTCVLEQAAGNMLPFFFYHNSSWKDANRAFKHTHVLIQNQKTYVGFPEQGLHDRDHHHIVCACQLYQSGIPLDYF